jgi:hypothetical protein
VSSVQNWILISIKIDHVDTVDSIHEVVSVELWDGTHVVDTTRGWVSAVREVTESVSVVSLWTDWVFIAGVVDDISIGTVDIAPDQSTCVVRLTGGWRGCGDDHQVIVSIGVTSPSRHVFDTSLGNVVKHLGWDCSGDSSVGVTHAHLGASGETIFIEILGSG